MTIEAVPGMTLSLVPAWMIVGLTVSRRSAPIARRVCGSIEPCPGPPGRAAWTALMARAMSGVARIGGCVPRRSSTRPAMTSGLSARGIDAWPDLPWTVISKRWKPFSAAWMG